MTSFFYLPLEAQDQPVQIQGTYEDIVYLKDGSEYRGKIIEYAIGEDMIFEILGGKKLIIPGEVIKRVVQQRFDENGRPIKMGKEKVYAFREKGIYNFFSVLCSTLKMTFGEMFMSEQGSPM